MTETPEWTEEEIKVARLAEIKYFGKVMFD